MWLRALLVMTAIGLAPVGAGAQEPDAATKALAAANDAMMAGMMTLPNSGDPDKDFVLMMIPHHEGAIAMAKVVLEYGDDPELKKLAQAIVESQSDEVAFMKAWLARQN